MSQTLDQMCEKFQEWTGSGPLPYGAGVMPVAKLAIFLLHSDNKEAQRG